MKSGRYVDLEGNEIWYLNGLLHREDGPAYETVSGIKQWFTNGIQITEEEFKHWIMKNKLHKKLSQLPKKPITKREKI